MHLCWWCQGDLVWDNDFDASDYFCEERDGIVTFLHCSKCNATVTYAEEG